MSGYFTHWRFMLNMLIKTSNYGYSRTASARRYAWIAMHASIIKATRHAYGNSIVKMSYTFLTMLIASETRSPDVDMNDVICLEVRNQKRNNLHPLIPPDQKPCRIDTNHLNAQRKFKTSVNYCRNTLHNSLNGTGLHIRENEYIASIHTVTIIGTVIALFRIKEEKV